MSPDEELMVIFGALHLIALMFGVVLFAMFLRSEAGRGKRREDEDDSGGGGGNDRINDRPKTSPSGGIPLPDAVQSRLRFRESGRLADAYRRQRRRVVEPVRTPRRVTTR
jgi:hypothetical protein